MDEQKRPSTAKKTIFFILGALLIIGTLGGGNLKYIVDWSTTELVGYNAWTLIALFGGAYLIYRGAKK